MKKNKLIVIAIIILAIVLLITGIVMLIKPKENKKIEKQVSDAEVLKENNSLKDKKCIENICIENVVLRDYSDKNEEITAKVTNTSDQYIEIDFYSFVFTTSKGEVEFPFYIDELNPNETIELQKISESVEINGATSYELKKITEEYYNEFYKLEEGE